jgi:hypothetical protein
MARYVVLSFEDNEDAETFIQHCDGQSSIIVTGKVEALIAKPTMFCPNSAAGGCPTGKRTHSFTRGLKWGWWVCAVCKKPVKLRDQKLMYNCISQGKNLLLEEPERVIEGKEQVATVWDAGWGVFGRSRWTPLKDQDGIADDATQEGPEGDRQGAAEAARADT